MAYDYGSLHYRQLYPIVASYFGLLGFPGTIQATSAGLKAKLALASAV